MSTYAYPVAAAISTSFGLAVLLADFFPNPAWTPYRLGFALAVGVVLAIAFTINKRKKA